MTQRVKAGDTVTATVTPLGDNEGPKPFEIKGEVYMDPFGDVLMVGAFRLEEENVTLTDHQPAPEPEPEWEHHGIYKATVRGESEVTVMYEDPKDHQPWKSLTGIGDAGYLWHAVDQVTDVRPLVVIDPTRAKDALTRTGISDGWRDTVLEALGIES